jgi:flagellar hook assembly protein FlgD
VVATLNTAVDGEGIHAIDLAEASNGLAPGQYTLSVETQAGGEGITVSALSSGVVQGVRWGTSGPVLVVGSTEVPLMNVLEITSQEPYQP